MSKTKKKYLPNYALI